MDFYGLEKVLIEIRAKGTILEKWKKDTRFVVDRKLQIIPEMEVGTAYVHLRIEHGEGEGLKFNFSQKYEIL